jgi:hypothetical protein
VPPLLAQQLEYRLTFSGPRVIVGHKNFKNVWHIVSSSYYSKNIDSNIPKKKLRISN